MKGLLFIEHIILSRIVLTHLGLYMAINSIDLLLIMSRIKAAIFCPATKLSAAEQLTHMHPSNGVMSVMHGII